MKIEYATPDTIKPYKQNPRIHNDAVEAVKKSLQEFGFLQPVVVDEALVIIAGHARWKAATDLKLRQVPILVARGLSPEKVRAYRIADNQTGALSEWDENLLKIELSELLTEEYDLDLLGFDPDVLANMLDSAENAGQGDPDEVPAPPDEAKTQLGDIWVLGEHRLMCGDSANPADLDRLLAGQPIHLVNMDPPYNVKVEPRSNNAIAAGNSSFQATHHQKMDLARHPEKSKPTEKKLRAKDRPLANDFVTDEEFDRLLDGWFGNAARVLVPGRAFYIWGGYANCANYPPFLKKHDLYFSQAIIWDKQHPVLTRKDFMGAHEWCFYGWKTGAAHKFYGPNNATDLWHVKKVNPQSMVHLTEKPVELAVRALEYSSKRGEHVLDLFGGSGSTLMGAQQTGRRAFLMELDPLYCDVIVQRWEQYTGLQAERIAAPAEPLAAG